MGLLSTLSRDNLPIFVGYIVLLTVAGYIVSTFYQAFLGSLSGIPGPWLAKFSRFWELREVATGHFEQTNIALHERHGPLVRIGPSKISISDPSVVKTLYAAGTKYHKSQFYHAFGDPRPGNANMFSEVDIHNHSQKRRRLASMYSMSALVTYEPYVDQCNETLCQKLGEIAASGRPFEVQQWMQFYAFDVIGEITTSKPFGFLEKGWDFNSILSSIHSTNVYGSRIGIFPELHKWIAAATQIFRMKIPFDVVQTWVIEQIEARTGREGREGIVKPPPGRSDFLEKALALRKVGKATDLDVLQTVGANVGAGSDTTSISLSSVIYGLCQNPAAARKLQKEIDSFAAEGKLSDPVTFDEAGRMPYLQACIKEGLRIHPAVGRPLLRVVPAGGAKLAGSYLPGGTVVGVNAWVLHRNEDIFGPEPKEFRPERWLNQDSERLSRMEQNFLAFGAGSRTCIGKNISLLEMTKVIPQLYRKFEFELAEPSGKMTSSEDWFVKQQFKCSIKVRE